MSAADLTSALAKLDGASGLLVQVVEEATFGVYVDHPIEGCIYANRALLDQFGTAWEEFCGFGWARHVHPEDAAKLRDDIDTYERQRGTIDVVYRVLHPGGVRWVHARVTALTDASGAHLGSVGVTLDVTTQRAQAQRSIEAQKLEAVGRLAARVAHDFNNVLGVILGVTGVLQQTRLGEEGLRELTLIEESVDHAASITSQLLTLAGAQARGGPCELDREIAKLLPLLERSLGEGVQLHVAMDAGGAWVPLARAEMGQVLLNLCLNARDALKGTGRIEVATEQREGRVQIVVRDYGVGMSVETQQRIFDPFFTTKPEGRGSGLGLSSVLELVRGVGGDIALQSALGGGTCFTVDVPRATPSPLAPPSGWRGISTPARAGRVLLVDDNDALRQTLAYALALGGHTVTTASTVQRAREQFAASPADVLVADVLLPDGNGLELFRELSVHRPLLPVVFMTGFAGEAAVALPRSSASVGLLSKPFPLTALVAEVERVLDAETSTQFGVGSA